jgi:hypothetical protein
MDLLLPMKKRLALQLFPMLLLLSKADLHADAVFSMPLL